MPTEDNQPPLRSVGPEAVSPDSNHHPQSPDEALEYLAGEEQRLKAWAAALESDREDIQQARANVTALIDHLDTKQKDVHQQMVQLDTQGKDIASRVELIKQLKSVQAAFVQEQQALVELRKERNTLLKRLESIQTSAKREIDLLRVKNRSLSHECNTLRAQAQTDRLALERQDDAAAAAFAELKLTARRSVIRREQAEKQLDEEKRDHETTCERLKTRIRTMSRNRADLQRMLDSSNAELDELKRRMANMRESADPKDDRWNLRSLASNSAFCRRLLGSRAVTTGSAPFQKREFDAFLRKCKVMVCSPGTDVGVMVVGEQGWKEEDLENQVRAREGKSLRVYSHFMFLHAMAMDADPFDVWTEKELLAVGQNHPALSFLMKLGFDWPSCKVKPGLMQSLDASTWPEEGILKHFGYTVGVHRGLPTNRRRRVLTKVFDAPTISGPAAVGDSPSAWGKPRSSLRLKRIAFSIAKFLALAQGRDNAQSYRRAVRHWQCDLQWLKEQYYTGRMRFRWPQWEVL